MLVSPMLQKTTPAFSCLLLVAKVAAHGALVNPLSRNAIDNRLPKAERSPKHFPTCSNLTGHEGCDNGQAQ